MNCKLCNQQVPAIPNKSKPATPSYHKDGQYMGHFYPTKPDPDGLCYYHKGKKAGLFDITPEMMRSRSKEI